MNKKVTHAEEAIFITWDCLPVACLMVGRAVTLSNDESLLPTIRQAHLYQTNSGFRTFY